MWKLPAVIFLILRMSTGMEIVPDDDKINELEESRGIYRLEKNQDRRHFQQNEGMEEFRIFCHKGRDPDLTGFWSSAEMRLRIDGDDYHVYVAENLSAVQEMHKTHQVNIFSCVILPFGGKFERVVL